LDEHGPLMAWVSSDCFHPQLVIASASATDDEDCLGCWYKIISPGYCSRGSTQLLFTWKTMQIY
jgi:hypothetical protein